MTTGSGDTASVPRPQIGDPGRAATEVSAGPPVRPSGHADIQLSSVSADGLDLRAATVRGLMHRRRREPRQDAYALAGLEAKSGASGLVAVVCDGVGEFADSHLGADLAAERVARLAEDGMSWSDVFSIVNEDLVELDRLSRSMGAERAGLATTVAALRIMAVHDAWLISAAWVGDSSVWLLDQCGNWTCISHPEITSDTDDYHSTSVQALPSRSTAPATSEFCLRSGAIFVVTDGVGNPLAWSCEVQQALAAWWAAPPDPFTFGTQVDFARRGHFDDRTAVGVWLSERECAGEPV